MHLVFAIRIVGKSTCLKQTFAPNLSEGKLNAEIQVPITCQIVDLIPNTAVVAVSVVVVADDIANFCHVVGVVHVSLNFVGLEIFSILINIIIEITAQQIIHYLIVMRS